MDKFEIKTFIKMLRQKQNEFNKKKAKHEPFIYLSIALESITGDIMEIHSPFAVDLRNGFFAGSDLITGEFKKVRFW